MTKRAAIYLRVSTDHQTTDLQKNEALRFVEMKGWTIVGIFEDHLSGGTTARPGLQSMLKAAENRKIDVIVTYRLDRFFRSLKDLLATLDHLHELKVDFVSIRDNLDFTTSAGRLMVHLLGAIAQFEKELTHSRVLAGLENAKRKGVRLGRPSTVPTDDIRLLRNRGLSLSAIAKKVGCSKSGVYKSLARGSFSNPVTISEIIEVSKSDFCDHNTLDLETTHSLPMGKKQCHRIDKIDHVIDFNVISDTPGFRK